jgi:hypothetical protein
MPGSAVLDPDVLVDDLMETIDELRREIPVELGARQYRAYLVLRQWTGSERGEGSFTDAETEITPPPLVESLKGTDRLYSAGLDEADVVRLKEISFSYTEAELTGPELDRNQQWLVRLKDAYGQQIRTRDFVLQGSPWPDRIKDIGWTVNLVRAPDVVEV